MDKALELAQNICRSLGIEVSEENCQRVQSTLAQKFPPCNACGKIIEDLDKRWGGPLKFSTNWGYESSGKDTDRDSWILCEDCLKHSLEQWSLICAGCRKTIPEVMAELDSHNVGHSYYGDYARALEHNVKPGLGHCGYEYALIEDRVLCEICYEKFVAKFKVPMNAGGYHLFDGTPEAREGVQIPDNDPTAKYPGRLAQILKKHTWEGHYEAILSWEEAVKARTELREQACISVSYREEDPELIARMKERDPDWEPTVYFRMANQQTYEIPVSWLNSKLDGKLDVKKLALENCGLMIRLGEAKVSAESILTSSWRKS